MPSRITPSAYALELRAIRHSLELTQREMAQKLGVTHWSYSSYERPKGNRHVQEMTILFARALLREARRAPQVDKTETIGSTVSCARVRGGAKALPQEQG